MQALSPHSRATVLRFAATFAWSDSRLGARERAFLLDLADELDLELAPELIAHPPRPEDVDPTRVDPALAAHVRDAALRAIAADGRVKNRELAMFDLLDELLPDG